MGEATVLDGKFLAFRYTSENQAEYIQTDINVAKGMSGGPLVNNCNEVVGVITSTLTGNSFFISIDTLPRLNNYFSDKDIAKIDLDPSKSPEEAVKAFYTYLKVRDMESGFNLLSSEYLQKTNFEEWTNRFTDILDVNVITTERESPYNNLVFVKFSTKNWVNNELVIHHYEGTWDTVFEDGVYKMREADIEEVFEPSYMWFWEN